MIRVYSKVLSRFGSIIDLGGIQLPSVNTRIDVSKNHKVKAIVLDFDLVWKSVGGQQEEQKQQQVVDAATSSSSSSLLLKILDSREDERSSSSSSSAAAFSKTPMIQPDLQKIESITQVLQLKKQRLLSNHHNNNQSEDDLTRIISRSTTPTTSFLSSSTTPPSRQEEEEEEEKTNTTNTPSSFTSMNTPEASSSSSSSSSLDIRTKYASKLRSKVDGGISALENIKYQKEESMKRGDASNHLYVRNTSINTTTTPPSSSSSSSNKKQWIATNVGIGKLFQFISHRSMILSFIPPLVQEQDQQEEVEIKFKEIQEKMNDLCLQLPQIHIHFTISGLEILDKSNKKKKNTTIKEWAKLIFEYLQVQFLLLLSKNNNYNISNNNAIILVSNQDEYLKIGKDMGMITCRILQSSSLSGGGKSSTSPTRRGNVTTTYTVQDISQVEDVINEINGISFNTVLSTNKQW